MILNGVRGRPGGLPPTEKTLLIIPVYNSSAYLKELITRASQQFDPKHILFLNDGSTDNSLSILKETNSRYLSFDRNRGKGAVLIDGFQYAMKHDYDFVMTMDSDLQHLPEEIPRFLENEGEGGIVVGRRQINSSDMPWPRRMSNRLTSAMISIFSNIKISDSQCGFRLIPLELLSRLTLSTGGYQLESELLLKAGAAGVRISQVEVSTVYNKAPSFINPLGDMFRFIRLIWLRIWL